MRARARKEWEVQVAPVHLPPAPGKHPEVARGSAPCSGEAHRTISHATVRQCDPSFVWTLRRPRDSIRLDTIRASQSQCRSRSSAVTASPASLHHHSHSIVAVAIAASRALPCRTCFFAARCNLVRSFLSSFFCFLAAFACEVHGERTGQEHLPQARPTKLRVTFALANIAAAV